MKRLMIRIFFGLLVIMLSACAKVDFKELEQNLSSELGPQPPPSFHRISTTEIVAYGNKQVDFLLVLDDSNSMLPDLKKLAARLSTFVNSLDASDIDWQICATTTRGILNSSNKLTYGHLLNWSGYTPSSGTPAHLLKSGVSNLNTIFTSTIDNLQIGGGYSGDERGIRATYDNFTSPLAQDCYREGAAISVILISDEDERSVGGDASQVKARDAANVLQPLEAEDLPENLVNKAQSVYGVDVRFTFNSIIVRPGDTACEALQDEDTSPSHAGHLYAEASRLTNGGVGSICDADYGVNLNTFKDKIVNSLTQMVLTCAPIPQSLKVEIDNQKIIDFKLSGKILKFSSPLIEGTQVALQYDCQK